MTHLSIPPEVLDEMGIGEDVIRISVGVEDVDDLIADLAQGLDA
ncbi:MAG: hypothetical protein JWN34_2132 [Bryobacterales bacterium]|nr:hypothetical protein [Bryobacterales bacterium]